MQLALVCFSPTLRCCQQTDRIYDLRQPARLNQTDAATGVDARNELRVLQVRIHARRRIEEPGAQQLRGLRSISLVAFEIVSECERLDCGDHLIHRVMIGDFVDLWIVLAVAPDVRKSVRRFRIRPEVRSLAHVVVLVAARRRDRFTDDGERACGERLLRLALKLAPCLRQIFVAVTKTLFSCLQLSGVKQEDARRGGSADLSRNFLRDSLRDY